MQLFSFHLKFSVLATAIISYSCNIHCTCTWLDKGKPSNKEAFLYIRLKHKTLLYTQLSHHACFTCEVNGFVQIRAVPGGPTTSSFGQVVSPTKRGSRAARLCSTNVTCTAF